MGEATGHLRVRWRHRCAPVQCARKRRWLAVGLRRGDNQVMTVIKINAITVPEGAGDEVARRFAQRAGSVDNQEGFEGFELLRPTDDRATWLVVTRWRDEESFAAWVASPAFAHGHAGPNAGPNAGTGAGADERPHAGGHPGGEGAGHGGAQGGPPMGLVAELWSYEPVLGSGAAD